jgi:hypothetical protein
MSQSTGEGQGRGGGGGVVVDGGDQVRGGRFLRSLLVLVLVLLTWGLAALSHVVVLREQLGLRLVGLVV